MNDSSVRNVVILGSGPAGLTAAIYASRANLRPVVYEGLQPGGQLTITTEIENFPGFPDGIPGPEIMDLFRKQAARFGAELDPRGAARVDLSTRPFVVELDGGEIVRARTLIIATGATARTLGLPSERRLMNRGVSMCATCDGFFFRDQDIVVVGGGDTALEEATFLTRFGRTVTLVHRRDKLRGSAPMQARAQANPKMQFAWNSVIDEILGDEKVEGVRLKNVVTGETTDRPCGAVFVAIGHKPNTDLFKGQLPLNEAGYLLTEGRSSRTAVEGVFACGDVQDWVYRQAITAAGSGCAAAIDCERWLEAQNF